MRWNKIKLFAAGLIFAAAVAVTGADAAAATVTEDAQVVSVGYQTTIYSVPNLKINGKAPKKLKKKVKAVQYSKNTAYSTYRTKNYFSTTSAYKTTNDYNKENGSDAYKYYPATSSYELTFKKAGTYKVSYTDYYSGSQYTIGYDDDYNGVIKKYNVTTGDYDTVAKAVYVSSIYTDYTGQEVTKETINGKEYNCAVEGYYEAENGSRYAWDDDDNLVPVSLATGADGKLHVKYSPYKKLTYTHVEVYKVLASTDIVKSVKLGKSTNTNYTVGKEGGHTQSIKRGKFLSGKSGKVTVTMGPNYKLTSILVRTYDENGNYVYTLAKNKGTVTYGQNKSHSESSEGATNKFYTTSMYKPTAIYSLYQNKTTGESTTVKSEGKDADGNQTFVIEKKRLNENPKTNKKQLLTTTYNVTRKHPYATSTYYTYYYTTTGQYFDSDGKIQTYTSSETSSGSLPIDYYTESTFYLK